MRKIRGGTESGHRWLMLIIQRIIHQAAQVNLIMLRQIAQDILRPYFLALARRIRDSLGQKQQTRHEITPLAAGRELPSGSGCCQRYQNGNATRMATLPKRPASCAIRLLLGGGLGRIGQNCGSIGEHLRIGPAIDPPKAARACRLSSDFLSPAWIRLSTIGFARLQPHRRAVSPGCGGIDYVWQRASQHRHSGQACCTGHVQIRHIRRPTAGDGEAKTQNRQRLDNQAHASFYRLFLTA